MVQISESWLDPNRDRPKWLAVSGGDRLVQNIESAVQQLMASQKQHAPIRQELTAIQRKQANIDKDYDRMIRAGHGLLTALSELCDDPQERSAYLQARGELFPKGLSTMQQTYAEEAGEVTLTMARLSPESIALLKKIKLPGGSFWTVVVERWAHWGKELGILDEQRRILEQSGKGKDEMGLSRTEMLNARNRWIRVVRHLESSLELADVDQAIIDALMGPLERMAQKSLKKDRPGEVQRPLGTEEEKNTEE